jgi:uncharacterized protein (DUF983 family)
MNGKGSKVYSVLHGVCPRCQQGKVFKFAPYKKLDFAQMNDHCAVCGQAFEPEPDFYQGAMFVSYALSTGLLLVVGAIMILYLNLGSLLAFSTMGALAIGVLPVIFRLSRLIWLNFFVRYQPFRPDFSPDGDAFSTEGKA